MGAVYAQLSAKERVQIERWKLAKVPVREMARVLQRSKATMVPVRPVRVAYPDLAPGSEAERLSAVSASAS